MHSVWENALQYQENTYHKVNHLANGHSQYNGIVLLCQDLFKLRSSFVITVMLTSDVIAVIHLSFSVFQLFH